MTTHMRLSITPDVEPLINSGLVTLRQAEFASLHMKGLSISEIARELEVNSGTVRNTLEAVGQKIERETRGLVVDRRTI